MIRRERRDGGEGEERGLRKRAERGYRDREKKFEVTLVRSITIFFCTHTYIYIYMDRPDYITLLACARG